MAGGTASRLSSPERDLGTLRRAARDAGIVDLVGILREADAEARRRDDWMQCDLFLPHSDLRIRIGERPPEKFKRRFQLVVKNEDMLRSPITVLSLGRAYVRGHLDIIVDDARDEEPNAKTTAENLMSVFQVRDAMRSGTTAAQALRLVTELAFSTPTRVNARAIQRDYTLETGFYHTFLDDEYHLFSQCRFGDTPETPDEFEDPSTLLNAAAKSKLDQVKKVLELEPGAHILDIGSGWGGVTKYFDEHDVNVTSLTLSEHHKRYVEEENEGRKGNHNVLLQDLLEHRRHEEYNAIVILGVIEHIPTYRQFCQRAWEALKPGGLLYLDASATKQKYALSAFTRRYTWFGAHSCLALADLVQELLLHGFEIVNIDQDSRDYARTMRAWALRLDLRHEEIARTWGEYLYRAFRVFLWGGAYGFRTDRLQAYTLVARRGENRGPRPGGLRRAAQLLAGLR